MNRESKFSSRGKGEHLFKPGQGGRPKGALNRVTVEQKERIEWVLEILDETLEESIRKLRPKEQVELWLGLQEFIRPKLQRMNVDIAPVEERLTKITFEVVHVNLPGESGGRELPPACEG